ncbi:HD domain-containing protein [Solimonas sp. K1W22B-7]|uniref:HD domain-containing protein n=1 Tax=Solimonas sp. K1W22B-7 TaxID=2303331 RepID=UPI0019696BBA|nr:HD domain-containing protein [Solimonas sp. K1W22B-7]
MELTKSKPSPSRGWLLCQFIARDLREVRSNAIRALKRQEVPFVARAEYGMPDSQACRKALELVTRVSPAFLLDHCLRSHAFAVAMAHMVPRKIDREVLFLGCVMHDLGLTQEHDHGDTFELDGARDARSHCLRHGISAERSDLVHEMIALHNSVGIAHKREPEIALIHFGAGTDVLGFGVKDIHSRTMQEILAEYPRIGFGEAMARLVGDQMQRKPRSYMTSMVALGFLNRLRKARLPGES